MKKLRKLSALLAALLLAFALGSCANESKANDEPQVQKVSIDSIDGAYFFEYEGDYKLDDCINANLKTETELLAYLQGFIPTLLGVPNANVSLQLNMQGFGCCSITAENAGSAGGKIYGRNFDYPNNSAMIIHTKPAEGYESVSTCYPYFVTGKTPWAPESEMERTVVGLSSIFAPLDGMNTEGLYISILQLDKESTNQTDPNKKDVTTTVAVRYILDNAASVEEALEILEGFNMHNVFKTAYHYAIADNTGKSVVVEYINNEMKVTDAKVVTNHYLTDNIAKPLPAETKSSMIRYKAAYDAGEAAEWIMTPEQVRDALKAAKAIRAEGDKNPIWSIWSAVFEPKAKKVTYYFREDYTKYVEVTFGN